MPRPGVAAAALVLVAALVPAPSYAAPFEPVRPIERIEPIEPVTTHRLTHGRRSLVAGIFLGYAGAGLVVSGAVLTLEPGPGGTRPTFGQAELGLAFTGASVLMAAGGALQIGGSLGQLDGLSGLEVQPRPGLRYVAISLAGLSTIGGVAGAIQTANPAWRRGSGVVVFGTAGVSLLAAALHTVVLIEADQAVRSRDPGVALSLTPTGLRLSGRF